MTVMLTTETITIDDDDVRLAAETPQPQGATLVLKGPTGTEFELPPRIQRMLMATLASVAANGEAVVGRLPAELTSTVAADILGVSRPTLMKWAREGRIEGFKVGSHTRFKREDVQRLHAERKKEQAEAFEALRNDDVWG